MKEFYACNIKRNKTVRINSKIKKKVHISQVIPKHFQKVNYRIDAYKAPLLIKPPVQQNLNKPPLFWTKSPLFEAFWGFLRLLWAKFSINLHLETFIF